MCDNKLTLNYSKTQFIVFGNRSATAALKKKQPTIVFGANLKLKNLGVIFDSTLSFEYQINGVIRKCYYHHQNIGRIRICINLKTYEMIGQCLIPSQLDYCNSLYSDLPKCLVNRLQRVQNTAARVIRVSRTKKFSKSVQFSSNLYWLPVMYRIQFKILLLVLKSLHGLRPAYNRNLFTVYQPICCLRSRNVSTFPQTTTLPWWKRLCASMTCRAALNGDKNFL